VLAIALSGSMVLAVSVRHARNIVAPVSFKGVWVGLPRTVLGFVAIGYCNAALAPHAPGGWWLGVFLIPLLGIATLTYWPFPSHHLGRGHVWYVKALIALFFLCTAGALFVNRAYMFDVLFFWMAGYSMWAWLSLTPEERRAYRETVRAAKAARVSRVSKT
jgi:phosphatidylserine synthase